MSFLLFQSIFFFNLKIIILFKKNIYLKIVIIRKSFLYECYVYTYFYATHENSACVHIEFIVLSTILYLYFIV